MKLSEARKLSRIFGPRVVDYEHFYRGPWAVRYWTSPTEFKHYTSYEEFIRDHPLPEDIDKLHRT